MIRSLLSGIRALIGIEQQEGATRDRARVVCRYPVLTSNGPATVVDVSRTGLRLEGVGQAQVGQHLWVQYGEPSEDGEDGLVEVEVVWVRKRSHQAGVRFVSLHGLRGTWVQQLLREVGLSDGEASYRDRKLRLATDLRAQLLDIDGGQMVAEGQVANLSVGGVLIQTVTPLAIGKTVRVRLSPRSQSLLFSATGTVLSCRPAENEQLVAVQFHTVAARDVKILKKFVFNLMKGRKMP